MSQYKITYSKARFPIQPRRKDGSKGCRGCGSDIPKGRSSWCSNDCVKKFEPSAVIGAVKKRDKEVCLACGYDYKKAHSEWLRKCYSENIHHRSMLARIRIPSPKIIEYDHITPFSEGGLTIMENIRSLCSDCHKVRTKKWHRTRRKSAKDQPEFHLESLKRTKTKTK